MGNSPSKQGSGGTNPPNKAMKRSTTIRRERRSYLGPEPLGIISHPYQQENPDVYNHESSSDDDDNYLRPRGLFHENVAPPDALHPAGKGRSVQSTGSLAYSESTASVSSRQKDTISNGSGKAKSGTKKGLFARLQMKNLSVQKEKIPFEQSLEYAKSQFYGESQEEDDFSDVDEDDDVYDGEQDIFSNGSKPSSRHKQRNSFPPRPYHTRHGSMNGGHNLSVFMDEKRLPTIPDVSYQSSTADYEEEDDVQDVSNLLGDLVEHDYQEEETSMFSKEYTVQTEEAKDLPSSYSDVKNECDRSTENEYIRAMNSMLDKQHASYVDGQEPLQDITMPRQNLGNLFANVNLTLNDTLNGSKYKSLDESHASDDIDDDARFDTVDKQDKLRTKDVLQESNVEGDDSYSGALGTDYTGSKDQVSIKSKADNSGAKANDERDEGDLPTKTQSIDDPNKSSFDDSNYDDSICNSNHREISDVLSESTVDRSKADGSLFQGNNACLDDELSASSEEDDNILDCTEYDILNRTDMTIRHSLTVKNMSNEANLKMLGILEDEDSSEESASKMLEQLQLNQDYTTVVTNFDEQNHHREERRSSPYPEVNVMAPTTSSAVNMLPTLNSIEEDEDDEKDLIFGHSTQLQMKDQMVSNTDNHGCVTDQKKENVPKITENNGINYKGPEIGTVIQLIKVARNGRIIQDDSATDTVREVSSTNRKKAAVKVAYSRQVAKNSVFLFSDQNVRREQPRETSKVDQDRLTLLKKEMDLSEEPLSSEASCQITSCDSLESIMEKLKLMKVENRKAFITKRNDPSVTISKTNGDLRICAISKPLGISRPLPTTFTAEDENNDHLNQITLQLENDSSIEISIKSPKTTLSSVGGSKRWEDEAVCNNESFMSTKNNKLDSRLSDCHGNSSRTHMKEIDDESGHSIYSEDISITELQHRHSAITPMKNPKSPYIRFKKAMRMFGKNDTKSSTLKQPRKTPPKRNASATKDDIVVTKATQNSTKKKRRLTSGIDAIAPRKPTLTNPMFRIMSCQNEKDCELEDKPLDSFSDHANITGSMPDLSGQNNIMSTTETDGAPVNPDSPYDERDELYLGAENKHEKNSQMAAFSADDGIHNIEKAPSAATTDNINSPLSESSAGDDFDDILKASSMDSPSTGTSFDDFEQVLHDSPSNSTHNSHQSLPHGEEPTGLRSAIKKSRGDRDGNATTNRVSWFGGIPSSESPETDSKLNRRLESSFEESHNVDATMDKAPPKRNRMSSFQVYSPARDSLASHSPPIVFSKSVKAPVNPTQMNTHSPFEHASTAHEESVASFSPVLGNNAHAGSSSFLPKREAAVANGGAVLSPVTGRRTPSQNKKWTVGMTPTKNWRQLKAEQDAKKKSSNKKKKKRFSGPLKAFNY